LIHEDDVLPVLDREAGGAGEAEHRAFRLIDQRAVAPAASDVACLGDGGARLAGLGRRRPQRRAKLYGGQLAIGALVNPRLAGLLILFREPRVEGAAEIDIAGMAAGGDDDALLGLNIDRVAAIHCDDSDHAPRVILLANDLRHLVTQEY